VPEWYFAGLSYQVEDPERFLVRIQRKLERASLAILCARDSERRPEWFELGLGKWTASGLRRWLADRGISVLLLVHTTATESGDSRAAIVDVLAGSKVPPLSTPPANFANFRVVAIMSSLNEADIIGPFCGPASTVEGHGHHPDMSDCVSMPTHRLPCSRAQDKIFRGDSPGADE